MRGWGGCTFLKTSIDLCGHQVETKNQFFYKSDPIKNVLIIIEHSIPIFHSLKMIVMYNTCGGSVLSKSFGNKNRRRKVSTSVVMWLMEVASSILICHRIRATIHICF